jgi:hypothetical protein
MAEENGRLKTNRCSWWRAMVKWWCAVMIVYPGALKLCIRMMRVYVNENRDMLRDELLAVMSEENRRLKTNRCSWWRAMVKWWCSVMMVSSDALSSALEWCVFVWMRMVLFFYTSFHCNQRESAYIVLDSVFIHYEKRLHDLYGQGSPSSQDALDMMW